MCRYIFTRLRSCARWLCAYRAQRSSVVGGNFGRRVVVLRFIRSQKSTLKKYFSTLFCACLSSLWSIISRIRCIHCTHLQSEIFKKYSQKSVLVFFSGISHSICWVDVVNSICIEAELKYFLGLQLTSSLNQ